MRIVSIKRASAPGEPGLYRIMAGNGLALTLEKQFYADGPSLFEWALQGDGVDESFPTKSAAMNWICSRR